MMRATCQQFRVLALLALLALAGGTPRFAVAATNAAPLAITNLGPSPVQTFRNLLAMDSKSRAEHLELHPPGMREPIAAKINEYLLLPAEEREVRLQATELRHYLTLLLPLTNRAELMGQIDEPMRSVVKARLETWEIMPPAMQAELLENERVVAYFSQLGTMTSAQRKDLLDAMSPEQRRKLEADIKRWRTLSETERSRSFAQFTQLFSLTSEDRAQALTYLSDAEREAMAATLDAFRGLTSEQRDVCIQSFQKFANMNLAERQDFLKKAAAWQRMTPAEREQWREVVRMVPALPPLPPGFIPPFATSDPATKTNSTPAGKTTNGG